MLTAEDHPHHTLPPNPVPAPLAAMPEPTAEQLALRQKLEEYKRKKEMERAKRAGKPAPHGGAAKPAARPNGSQVFPAPRSIPPSAPAVAHGPKTRTTITKPGVTTRRAAAAAVTATATSSSSSSSSALSNPTAAAGYSAKSPSRIPRPPLSGAMPSQRSTATAPQPAVRRTNHHSTAVAGSRAATNATHARKQPPPTFARSTVASIPGTNRTTTTTTTAVNRSTTSAVAIKATRNIVTKPRHSVMPAMQDSALARSLTPPKQEHQQQQRVLRDSPMATTPPDAGEGCTTHELDLPHKQMETLQAMLQQAALNCAKTPVRPVPLTRTIAVQTSTELLDAVLAERQQLIQQQQQQPLTFDTHTYRPRATNTTPRDATLQLVDDDADATPRVRGRDAGSVTMMREHECGDAAGEVEMEGMRTGEEERKEGSGDEAELPPTPRPTTPPTHVIPSSTWSTTPPPALLSTDPSLPRSSPRANHGTHTLVEPTSPPLPQWSFAGGYRSPPRLVRTPSPPRARALEAASEERREERPRGVLNRTPASAAVAPAPRRFGGTPAARVVKAVEARGHGGVLKEGLDQIAGVLSMLSLGDDVGDDEGGGCAVGERGLNKHSNNHNSNNDMTENTDVKPQQQLHGRKKVAWKLDPILAPHGSDAARRHPLGPVQVGTEQQVWGSVKVLTPVKASRRDRELLGDDVSTVLTPVRRSTRRLVGGGGGGGGAPGGGGGGTTPTTDTHTHTDTPTTPRRTTGVMTPASVRTEIARIEAASAASAARTRRGAAGVPGAADTDALLREYGYAYVPNKHLDMGSGTPGRKPTTPAKAAAGDRTTWTPTTTGTRSANRFSVLFDDGRCGVDGTAASSSTSTTPLASTSAAILMDMTPRAGGGRAQEDGDGGARELPMTPLPVPAMPRF